MSLSAALATRREMLGGGAALMLLVQAGRLAAEERMEEVDLYGLMGKMTAQPGKRAELVGILGEGTREMPGCLLYLIAEDRADADAIWISEVWKSKALHDDSLKLPAVKAAIAKGRPLIAGFGDQVAVRPVAGHGLAG